MSLINEMLKDLEARGSGGGNTTAVRASRTKPAARGQGPVLFLLALLVLLLAGALAYLLWPDAEETRTTTLAVVPAHSPAPPANSDAPAAVLPVDDAPPATIDAPLVPAAATDDDVAGAVIAPTDETLPAIRDAAPEPAVVPEEEVSSTGNSNDVVIVRKHELTPDEKALRAAREGFAALRRGDWLTASRLLQELIAVEPGNDDAREGLVVALMRQGRLAETDGVLLDGFAVAGDPARFAKLRARLQVSRGEFDAALDSLSVAVPDVAADPEYHALKAAVAQQGGHYELAARVYRALTALEPANATWQAGSGMALDQLNDVEGARAAYERALQAGGLEPALLEHVQQRQRALAETKE